MTPRPLVGSVPGATRRLKEGEVRLGNAAQKGEASASRQSLPRLLNGCGSSSLSNDLTLQSSKSTEQFILLGRADLELIEGFHQIFDQRGEVSIADVHALVRRHHVFAFVFARAAGSLANLVDQIVLEPRQTLLVFRRVGEEM